MKKMHFLFKVCLCISFIVVELCVSEQQQHCLSPNYSASGKCQDWKEMSVLVADLVGRSTVEDKIKTKSNILTLIIRVASGVIGHGASTLKTLIVNGLMLLSQTVLKASEDVGDDQTNVPATGGPIDWVLKNSYIKSKIREATSDDLPDRLEQLAFGMPCVQLLMCRIAPVVRHMQYEVKGRWGESRTGHKPWGYNGTCWDGVKSNSKSCSEKYYVCEKSMKYNNN